MSFILDALRKSEHERRMETAPDIMHAPVAVAQAQLPPWVIFLIGGLAAALVAISIYAVVQRSGENSAPPVAAPVSPAAPAIVSEIPAIPTETVQRRVEMPIAADTATAAEPQPRADTMRVDTQPLVAAEVTDTIPAVDTATLPSYATVVAEGSGVGALQMQLHVHSSSPASRFIVVNGSRHREGDRLAEGPQIETIVAEGAILSYQGRRFLLTAN